MIEHTRKTQRSLGSALPQEHFWAPGPPLGLAMVRPRSIRRATFWSPIVAGSVAIYPNNRCSGAAELYDPSLGTCSHEKYRGARSAPSHERRLR
jgi:hypothetical protein